jgi:hypothetical protein
MLINPTITIDNWDEYCAHNFCDPDPVGFIEGTECATAEIARILNATTSYDDLKKELVNYIDDRKNFVKEAITIVTSGSFKNNPNYQPESLIFSP